MARACVHASVISHVAAAAATFVSSRLSLFYISAFGQSGRGHGAEEAAPWATTIWIGGIYINMAWPIVRPRLQVLDVIHFNILNTLEYP